MLTSNRCYDYKYFEEAFGYLEEGCKCRKTGKYVNANSTCAEFSKISQQYLDFEDDYDKFGY